MVTDRIKMESFSSVRSALWWHVGTSLLTGLFGTLLIVVVVTGVLPLGQVVVYLPWILGFNAAVCGYTLLDRSPAAFRYKKAAGAGVGFMVGLLTCTLLDVLTLQLTGLGLMGWSEMAVPISMAVLFGYLGAWLAVAQSRIKENAK